MVIVVKVSNVHFAILCVSMSIEPVYGIVPTSDSWIALVGVPPQQREGFYAAIGRSELLDDERFQPFILDREDRKELFIELRKTFETRTTAEWGIALTEAGCRWAPVNDYAAATADPHSMINGYMQDIDHPEYGKVKMMGSPIRMSGTPVVPGQVSPELGADTEMLLVELGYDWDQIGAMRESGSI